MWPLFEKQFQVHQEWSDQPLLVPLLLAEIALDNCQRRLGRSEEALDELEETMGQHEYHNRPRRNPPDMDFVSSARKLNFIGNDVAKDVARLQSFTSVLKKIVEFKGGNLQENNCGEEALKGNWVLDDKLAYLFDVCRVLQTQSEYEEKRIYILTQVVRPPFPVLHC